MGLSRIKKKESRIRYGNLNNKSAEEPFWRLDPTLLFSTFEASRRGEAYLGHMSLK